jgi:nucleotide sugar dehydrogenase
MKIGIVGLGYVGSAVAWSHRADELIVVDPKLTDSAKLSDLVDCDGIYVCVSSPPVDPTLESGACDTSILEKVLKDLTFINIANSVPIICKTTAPPRVYAQLQELYPNIVYSPEFLTARNHITDYVSTSYLVIGGDDSWCQRAYDIMHSVLPQVGERVFYTDIKSAALYKYMMNSYLAAKVTFMNDFKKLADAEGVSWRELCSLSAYDNRLGRTHLEVPGPDGEYGWGGACFPKDVAAIIEEALNHNIDFELLQRVESINNVHRRQR